MHFLGLSTAKQPLLGLITEVSQSHPDTPHSVGLLWTSDRLDAEISTLQYTTLTTDIHPSMTPTGFEPRNPSKRYKPAGLGFDSRWCNCNFSVT